MIKITIEQYLDELLSSNIIKVEVKNTILKLIDERVASINPINEVLTLSELLDISKLHMNTIVRDRNAGKFKSECIRKARGTWLITKKEALKYLETKK